MPQFINITYATSSNASIQQELTASLLKPAASLSPKFFYDALGSKLFEAITLLDEYYPTRTEASIFEAHNAHIARAVADSGIKTACLIDLGAGNCAKAAALMPFLSTRQYVPVDISVDFLREAADNLQARFPALDIVGVGMDFSSSLTLPDAVQSHDRVFFYPGSIDLVKDAAVLQAAYDDAVGVTAAFNKNVLLHVNALLGADFDLRQWRHVALFNLQDSRIEMHLEAITNTTVRWASHERSFAAGERIHTENSYKYTLDGMTTLLKQAGFSHVQHWTDAQGWFGVFWASK